MTQTTIKIVAAIEAPQVSKPNANKPINTTRNAKIHITTIPLIISNKHPPIIFYMF